MKVTVNAHIEKIVFKGDEAQVTLTLGKVHGLELMKLTSARVGIEVDDFQEELSLEFGSDEEMALALEPLRGVLDGIIPITDVPEDEDLTMPIPLG
jgi:hypothetical protein